MRIGPIRLVRRFAMLVALLAIPCLAHALSLLPLATQEARTLPNGKSEAILSVGYASGLWFPPFTQPGTVCCQQIVSAPTLGFNIGLGSRVEVQASYELLLNDETILGQGHQSNYGSGDARLFTKVLVFHEDGWIPALGV